jgi:diguanylate cyclase (GGDEF)-like protein
MKILVADDDATSRLLIEVALRSLGHECHSVSDGAQAWDAIQWGQPDVVISDWTMPELSGIELCRKVRAHPRGGYTYFIMVTMNDTPDQMLEGMGAGVDDYLVKPLDVDDLRARLIGAARVTAVHRQLIDQRAELEQQNHELTRIARRDPLTGLGNRRALQEDLELIDARVQRYGHEYCMALLDVDHFKAYNDTYGHPAGDQVLQKVSAQLEHQARGGDALYRYGGEEFLCIFPEQSIATGTIAVERMRAGVQRLALPHEKSVAGVLTISGGLAMLNADAPSSASKVLEAADQALYRAKQLGRNRVSRAAPQRV